MIKQWYGTAHRINKAVPWLYPVISIATWVGLDFPESTVAGIWLFVLMGPLTLMKRDGLGFDPDEFGINQW